MRSKRIEEQKDTRATHKRDVTFQSWRNIWWNWHVVGMSLFVAGVIFGDVAVSVFVASALNWSYSDVGVLLLGSGAVFGEVAVAGKVVWWNLEWELHDVTPRHMTSPDMTSPNQPRYLTSLHLTANRITSSRHLATNHLTSYLTSHLSTSHRHRQWTTETQPATTTTRRQNGWRVEGWCTQKIRRGHRTGWWPCAHSTSKFSLWLMGVLWFLLPILPPPARPGTAGMCLLAFYMLVGCLLDSKR